MLPSPELLNKAFKFTQLSSFLRDSLSTVGLKETSDGFRDNKQQAWFLQALLHSLALAVSKGHG